MKGLTQELKDKSVNKWKKVVELGLLKSESIWERCSFCIVAINEGNLSEACSHCALNDIYFQDIRICDSSTNIDSLVLRVHRLQTYERRDDPEIVWAILTAIESVEIDEEAT